MSLKEGLTAGERIRVAAHPNRDLAHPCHECLRLAHAAGKRAAFEEGMETAAGIAWRAGETTLADHIRASIKNYRKRAEEAR